MKLQTNKRLLSVILAVIAVFSVFSVTACSQKENPDTTISVNASAETLPDELWKDALYTEDKSFGDGEKTLTVEVVAGEKSITFTLKTDKENLADAMLEHSLVEGTQDQYGLYIKKVNGILADYDIDKSYWSLSKNGQALMTGASGTNISDGDKYEFTYAK